ncbi:MAG: hypothetical protein QF357_03165 [Dehalococcoidia bacterium]|nr:hypothetical protein [Dehalococcoidia bacterium]
MRTRSLLLILLLLGFSILAAVQPEVASADGKGATRTVKILDFDYCTFAFCANWEHERVLLTTPSGIVIDTRRETDTYTDPETGEWVQTDVLFDIAVVKSEGTHLRHVVDKSAFATGCQYQLVAQVVNAELLIRKTWDTCE